VAFSPDGQYLASGSWDKSIKLWSVQSHKQAAILQEHSGYVLALAFSADGKYLASGSGDNTVKLWSVQLQKVVTTLQGHNKNV
jgi:WD40 repeat protein